MNKLGLALALALVASSAARGASPDYAGASDDRIRQDAGHRFRGRASEVAPKKADRAPSLDACLELLKTRQEVFDAIGKVRRFTAMDGIVLADCVDDSLMDHMGTVLIPYPEAHPSPIQNPGSEKYRTGLDELGFVREWATGFLVHLEMQQSLLLLADFRVNRSEAEVEAAEDAFLRHFAMLCQLYRAQHKELEDLHSCSLANMEWALGRLESDKGTSDFVMTEQYFSQGDDGFGYYFELASPTTGEKIQATYPLPFLTAMDELWPAYKKELEKKKKEEAAAAAKGSARK